MECFVVSRRQRVYLYWPFMATCAFAILRRPWHVWRKSSRCSCAARSWSRFCSAESLVFVKVSGLVNCKLFGLICCSRLSTQRLKSLWFRTVAYHLAHRSTFRLSAHRVFSVILMFIGPCIIAIVDEWKTNLMSLAILFHFLCAQHVSHINISIFRNLRLCWWITTSVVLFSVRCVLELLLLVFGGVRFAGCKTNTT